MRRHCLANSSFRKKGKSKTVLLENSFIKMVQLPVNRYLLLLLGGAQGIVNEHSK